ncbi:Uncharacterised protein [Helicobacter cinaedi]|uniref:Uncharacterized protein n=1 Tax=Helicobacter cinaedi TaxID=213 RepID=A0A377JT12_9HELI|nr:hypothetical protein [Helicobacter cinaedi]STP11131.1 Uncharacterised protein [Helicobacter cinaedi]
MFSKESLERLKDVSHRIQNIFDICQDYGDISLALNDVKIAQPANDAPYCM